jgi:type IV pilus assembly protein PilA
MIVCPYCQAQNADTAGYCIRCGQAVASAGGVAVSARQPTGEGQKKGLAVTSLVAGILSLPTLGCLGIGAIVAIVCGILALVKTKNEPAVYGGKGMAIAGIVTGGLSFLLLPFIGIVAAIAIPSLLRARVAANEAAAIGDVRTVISAQAAYASANGGYYDRLECLGPGASCIPDYGGPTFLDSALASGMPRSGYQRTLYLGEPADSGSAPQPISPSSVRSFAYVATPVQQGQTGVRAFCGDLNGIVCFTADGSEPEVAEGQCVIGPRCAPLR